LLDCLNSTGGYLSGLMSTVQLCYTKFVLGFPKFFYTRGMPRRSYDQYCPLSRALDVVGERWALLIVRELLAGPRRYTDLHADLPGISTDVLAARLKEMERDGLVTRHRLGPPAVATVYELTPRGHGLLATLTALAGWGTAGMEEEPRPTDALRAHWSALPLMRLLAGLAAPREGIVFVRLGEGSFHVTLTATGPSYGHGLVEHPHAQLVLDGRACADLIHGYAALPALVREHRASVEGDGPVAQALRGQRAP
jgi:DNA-binding HxlR family transcriptional regulator